MTSQHERPRDSPAALFALVLLSALAGARGTSASGLPGKWVEARSAHFVVLGNVSEKKVREVARDFFLPICDKGVELSPANGTILDSRAVAKGVTGDSAGAAADLRAALAAKENYFTDEERALRESWLATLGQGGNPFTPGLLQDLLYGPLSGLRWGR